MFAGCYTLDLYCENEDDLTIHRYNEFPHTFLDEYGSKCRADARKRGWIIRRDGTSICPKCSGKIKF